MDLRINSTTTAPLAGAGLARRATGIETPVGKEGFSSAFKNALQSVSAAQDRAGDLQREVQLENPAVSLEQTMVAMQKSQIGFQATLHVRNRLVQAYSDVMNMQV